MSGLSDDPTVRLRAGIESLVGGEAARMVSIAMLALTVFDWFLTLDTEVKHFWSGRWTLSRLLFFVNRYTVPAILSIYLYVFLLAYSLHPLRAHYIVNITSLAIIQLMLALRVWYLFPDKKGFKVVTVLSYFANFGVAMFFATEAAVHVQILPNAEILPGVHITGCRAGRPHHFWRMLLPGLIFHALMYGMTAFSAFQDRHLLSRAPLMKRLLRDGGIFFLVVLLSVVVTTIGSFLEESIAFNIVVIFSTYNLAINSLALSRVMLSIHSLSDNLGVNSSTSWMLSFSEMQRVQGLSRLGQSRGEIVIEKDYGDSRAAEKDLELARIGSTDSFSTNASQQWVMKATRVDVENAYYRF
ncbi:hypothetical protein DL96DRAFT_1580403 [Flagelloscypha sp. PMI_526]|nr:hypothetical protein DL96DRAFT_1580403 [Flagelloscypha sp. PMI_526]